MTTTVPIRQKDYFLIIIEIPKPLPVAQQNVSINNWTTRENHYQMRIVNNNRKLMKQKGKISLYGLSLE